MEPATLWGAWPEPRRAAAQPGPEFTCQDANQGLADPLCSSLVDCPVSGAIPAFPFPGHTLVTHACFPDSFSLQDCIKSFPHAHGLASAVFLFLPQ